jgi:hypothetical protein
MLPLGQVAENNLHNFTYVTLNTRNQSRSDYQDGMDQAASELKANPKALYSRSNAEKQWHDHAGFLTSESRKLAWMQGYQAGYAQNGMAKSVKHSMHPAASAMVPDQFKGWFEKPGMAMPKHVAHVMPDAERILRANVKPRKTRHQMNQMAASGAPLSAVLHRSIPLDATLSKMAQAGLGDVVRVLADGAY